MLLDLCKYCFLMLIFVTGRNIKCNYLGGKMNKKLLILLGTFAFLGGCASVPTESVEVTEEVKKFELPEEDKAGLYVYRDSTLGGALKKDIWVDTECLGESAPRTFFYKQVPGDKEYTLSTESEFGNNNLKLFMENGQNYFVRQYLLLGVFVGRAKLELMEAEKAKASIANLKLAKNGVCSKELKEIPQ